VPSHAIGQDAFQECDTVGITRPVVKHNFLVKDVKDLARTIKKAFLSPAPAVPARCWSISRRTSACTSAYEYPKEIEMRSYKPVDKGHAGQIRKAVQLLLQAERPMIYTGGGVILANASPELNKLVDKLGFPVTNTLMGLGAYRASERAFRRHARHARHLRSEHGDAALRRPDRHRRPLRRPRDRQPEALRQQSAQDHPRRHRPVVDLQAGEGRHSHRRQRQGRADRIAGPAGRRRREAQPTGRCKLVEADRRMARQATA
jgi:hypothetical protein